MLTSQTVSSVKSEDIENACWEVLNNEGWGDDDLKGVTIQMAPARNDGKGGSELVVSGPSCKTIGTSLREAFNDGRHALVTAEDKGKGNRSAENYKRRGAYTGGKGTRQNQRNGTAAWSENREWHQNSRQNW
jgi:hypothetical protein